MYCFCIVEVFSFLVGTILFLVFGLFYARRLVLLLVMCTETYDGSRKDEVLADAASPLDVVADKI